MRDFARYVSKAAGKGGSFIRIEDPAPRGDQLTAIDGFEITGYAQAIVREFTNSQRFDLTNNHIHDNTCANRRTRRRRVRIEQCLRPDRGNVLRNNSCGRGGAGFLNDSQAGKYRHDRTQPHRRQRRHRTGRRSRRRALSFRQGTADHRQRVRPQHRDAVGRRSLCRRLDAPADIFTTATLSWNIYRDNRAGNGGGGFFCDDGATCTSDHEIYDRNCGGNIFLDNGPGGSGPTIARFDHLTNVDALDVGCAGPGAGVRIDRWRRCDHRQLCLHQHDLLGQRAGPRFRRVLRQALRQGADRRLAFDGADEIFGARAEGDVRGWDYAACRSAFRRSRRRVISTSNRRRAIGLRPAMSKTR